MLTVGIIAGLLAVLNTIFFCISNFKKNKKEITFWHMCCSLCDFFMYLILGAKTGLANAVANICKNAAYSKLDSMKFTVVFSILRIGLLGLGYEGFVTILFIVIEVISVGILKWGTAQQFRVLTAVRQLVWVVYDFMFATVVVAVLTFIGFIGCAAAVIKNRRKV